MFSLHKLAARSWRTITVLAVAAGVLYNSWPLGYILNPSVNKQSLASGLEASGQPYNWVFIGGDVISSLIMLVVCWQLWLLYRQSKARRLLIVVIASLVIFSVGTIIDAALPERCVPQLNVCPSFNHDMILFAHGVFSILASVGLFISLLVIWWRKLRNILLNCLMAGYVLFGLVSLVEAIVPGYEGNLSQHYYITLCSVWLAVIPFAVHLTMSDDNKVKKKTSD